MLFFLLYNKRMSHLKTLVGDRVLIKPIAVPEVTDAGIIIPQARTTAKELPCKGVVAALPDPVTLMGRPDPNSFLKVGDEVLYNAYGGGESVSFEDENGQMTEYKLMFLDSIYCIVSPQLHAIEAQS